MERVVITQGIGDVKVAGIWALCYMQVCAVKGATDEEILATCNRENPCGTTNGWTVVERGESERWPGAVQCEDEEDREHLLVTC